MENERKFIRDLVDADNDLNLEEFFNKIHQRFHSNLNLSFMAYFIMLLEHGGQFFVHHEKLIEYGVVVSERSGDIKKRLNVLGLVEGADYELRDVSQLRPQGGTSIKKVYHLTPNAFKKCLMRALRRSKQTIDPAIYCDYFLLLEEVYSLYKEYQGMIKDRQHQREIEQARQREEQACQREEEARQETEFQKKYSFDLEETFLASREPLVATEIIYIATSNNYQKRNRFKVGGSSSIGLLSKRISTYNTGRARGDDYFCVFWCYVLDYHSVEQRLESLLGRFRERKNKEMYVLHFDSLKHILEYIVDHLNDEMEEVNRYLETIIRNLNINTVPPAVLTPISLEGISPEESPAVDTPPASPAPSFDENKLQEYLQALFVGAQNQLSIVVKIKDVLNHLKIKKNRNALYPILQEWIKNEYPEAKIKKW
jgi:hypothetical protein